MRQQGKVTKWKDDQGFGFITPTDGGQQVFVHIKSFLNLNRRPIGNEFVIYEAVSDERGRIRAKDVEFVGENFIIPASAGTISFAIPAVFFLFLAVTVLVDQLPSVILVLYLVASAASFVIYGRDKSAAQRGHWRTPESTLHILSLCGGWPGAFIAQRVFRHKSKKRSFRVAFWGTVVLNCAGLVWVFSPSGSEALRSILDAAGLLGK